MEAANWIVARLKEHHVGADKAITAKKLSAEMSAIFEEKISERDVREKISTLRMFAIPIASNCAGNKRPGFFIPATEKEALDTISSMRHRAQVVMMAARGVEKGLMEKFGNQLSLKLSQNENETK